MSIRRCAAMVAVALVVSCLTGCLGISKKSAAEFDAAVEEYFRGSDLVVSADSVTNGVLFSDSYPTTAVTLELVDDVDADAYVDLIEGATTALADDVEDKNIDFVNIYGTTRVSGTPITISIGLFEERFVDKPSSLRVPIAVAKTYIRPGIESLSVDSQGIDVAYTGTGSVPEGLITAVPDDLGPDQTVHSSFNAGEWEIEMRLSPGWDVSGVDLRALMDSGPGSRISIHSAQNRGLDGAELELSEIRSSRAPEALRAIGDASGLVSVGLCLEDDHVGHRSTPKTESCLRYTVENGKLSVMRGEPTQSQAAEVLEDAGL